MKPAAQWVERSEDRGFPRDCITLATTACVLSPGIRTLANGLAHLMPSSATTGPQFEKICIRFDDWYYDAPYSTIRETQLSYIIQYVRRYECPLLRLCSGNIPSGTAALPVSVSGRSPPAGAVMCCCRTRACARSPVISHNRNYAARAGNAAEGGAHRCVSLAAWTRADGARELPESLGMVLPLCVRAEPALCPESVGVSS